MLKVGPTNKSKKQKTQAALAKYESLITRNTFEDLTDHFWRHPTFKDRMSREQLFDILKFPHGLMTIHVIVSVADKLFDRFTVEQLATLAGCAEGFANIYHLLSQEDLREAGLLVNKGRTSSLLPWVTNALTVAGSTPGASTSSESETQVCGKRSFASLDSTGPDSSITTSTMTSVDSYLYPTDDEFAGLLSSFSDERCHPISIIVTPETHNQTPSEAHIKALASMQSLPVAALALPHVSATLQRS
jgi:hypothetical protein